MEESKPKRNKKFNLEYLHQRFLTLSAKLIGVESININNFIGDLNLNSSIDFICSCGLVAKKKFQNIDLYGAFCEECGKREKVIKIQAGKKHSLPIEKSFVSHPQFKFFVQELNPEIDPRRIGIQSAEPLILKCPDCFHIFQGKAHGLRNCRFCENQELCENEECITCFNKSLASRQFVSIEKYQDFKTKLANGETCESLILLFLESCAIYDFKNNKETCRSIFKSTNKYFLFICRKCEHSFPSQPSRVESLIDCPFCSPSNAKMLCQKEKNCNKCFVK